MEDLDLDAPQTMPPPPVDTRAEIEMQPVEPQDFYQRVAGVKQQIADARGLIAELERTQANIETAVDQGQLKDICSATTTKLTQIDRLLGTIRNALKQLAAERDQFKSGSAEGRIRRNMTDLLSRKFMEVMEMYNRSQLAYKDRAGKRLQRTRDITRGPDSEPSDPTMDSAEQLATMDLTNSAHDTQLREMVERNQDIRHLEQSIRELHQLFNDFHVLVEGSQEYLDQIESNLMEADEYMVKGNDELMKAKKTQNSNRKCMCCLFFLFIILGVLVVSGALGGILGATL
eukprot:gnl/Trimastix_PCT/2403.p1 GENE.gnl/Trimastix_PCT/2403~~gnl/Trimastix_PCT/2403.p1  ORF type:complete len:304 (+),score=57.44 gnl/Trimastix_PCT/2403:49-912(+)